MDYHLYILLILGAFRLWNKDTGTLLAQTNILLSDNWQYVEIAPVNVYSNTNYTVACYGYNIRQWTSLSPSLPQTYDDIKIIGGAWHSSDERPTTSYTTTMYGADIVFVPDE